jgi:signal transduction histidine kinase
MSGRSPMDMSLPLPATPGDSTNAAYQYRLDMQSRLMRLMPVMFVAVVALTLLSDAPSAWSKAVQLAACVVMAVSYVLRRRISVFKSAVLIVASLYLQAICVASTQGAILTCAFAIALALIVMQIAAGAARRWLRALTCIASYLGIALVILTYATESQILSSHRPTVEQTALLPWMLMSVSFVYFAFIVLVESEKMLQQIQASGRTSSPSNNVPNELNVSLNHESSNAPAYAALNDQNRALHEINRDLETFMYAISHDLRAPLRAVEGYSRMLTEDLDKPISAAVSRDLAGMRSGIERMQQMLTNWLRLAKRQEIEVRRERVDITAIAQTQVNELRMSDPHRSIAYIITADMTACADSTLVTELLQNLIGNAWKFSQHNLHSTLIEVGSRYEGGEHVFYVRDNGVGFKPSDADKLFRPFQRLHSVSNFEGTGIGLAIAQRIIERHQGRIWAEGREGRGATFYFTLQSARSQPAAGLQQ